MKEVLEGLGGEAGINASFEVLITLIAREWRRGTRRYGINRRAYRPLWPR
jgi:hypothetical protein